VLAAAAHFDRLRSNADINLLAEPEPGHA
jgi:hypothetical protein